MFCLYVHYSFTLELLNIVNYIISLNYTMLKPSFRIGRSNVLSTNFVPLSCLRCFGVLLKPMCLFPFCFLRNNPDAVTENRPFHELYPFIFVDVLDILTFWEVAYERAVVVVVVVVVVVNVVGPMEDRATVVDGGFEAKEKKDDAKRVAMLFSAFPLAVAAPPPSPLNNVLVKVAADNEAYDVPADVVAPYEEEEEEEEEEEARKARSSVLLNMLFFSACVGKKCSFFSLSLSLSQLSNKNRSFKGAIYCARAIRMKYVTKLKVLVATATFTSTATTVGGTSDDLGKRTVPVQFVFFFLSRFDCGG
jgi:hypothetical protein